MLFINNILVIYVFAFRNYKGERWECEWILIKANELTYGGNSRGRILDNGKEYLEKLKALNR